MRFLTILLLASACGGGAAKSATTAPMPTPQEPADPIPTTSGPECVVVADKVAPVAKAEEPDAQEPLRAAVKARCTEDKWSDEARSCFATVENDAELEGCMTKLTAEQREAAAAAFDGDAASPTTGAMPAKAAAPPPPAGPKTRGAAERNSSDPEEGGE